MTALSKLTPSLLWNLFSEICAIPHPSYHEQALADFIIDLAKKHNIKSQVDAVGNILLSKQATIGMENRQSVVLQAHLDMVPQKNNSIKHDFEKDPIKPYIDGDWVRAKNTTLGADNGIGMASALAVLIDSSVEHGPIEVLLTRTEEAGMIGAFGLQPNWVKSNLLINTDSETESEVYIGCAGGVNFQTNFPLYWQNADQSMLTYDISLIGLKGGHSGANIHLGLGNANKLLARFLFKYAKQLDYRLVSINGGTIRNAIPREAYATILIAEDKKEQLRAAYQEFSSTVKNEYIITEPNLDFNVVERPTSAEKVLDPKTQKILVAWLNSLPNGVIKMSQDIAGVVETSLNLGVIKMDDDNLTIIFLIRSLVDSAKDYVIDILSSSSLLVGASYLVESNYPGWKPNENSTLLKLVQASYQKLFNEPPKIMVIHAGLECGLFKNSYPDMDMVSFGPTIEAPHSPDERVNIKSVTRYWQLLIATLKSISTTVE